MKHARHLLIVTTAALVLLLVPSAPARAAATMPSCSGTACGPGGHGGGTLALMPNCSGSACGPGGHGGGTLAAQGTPPPVRGEIGDGSAAR